MEDIIAMDGVTLETDPMTDQQDTTPEADPGPDASSVEPAGLDSLPGDGAPADEMTGAEAATSPAGQADEPTEILPHRVVEAILFASDSPMPAAKIAQVLGVGNARDVRKHIEELNRQYAEWKLSFRVEEIAGGFQMMTLPAYNTWLAKLLRARQETRLSQAAMETLAIVAYKQPCTRADVEVVRGVAAGDLLNRLREMNLVKIVGRAEDLGRPLLYGTTKRFLEVFGLPSLEDLPQVEALASGAKAVAAAPAVKVGEETAPTPVAEAAAPQAKTETQARESTEELSTGEEPAMAPSEASVEEHAPEAASTNGEPEAENDEEVGPSLRIAPEEENGAADSSS